jgi:capsule polysaccharide export protein KpsE/RkpR
LILCAVFPTLKVSFQALRQISDLEEQLAEVKNDLAKARAAAAAAPNIPLIRSLSEQNRTLATRNAELENSGGQGNRCHTSERLQELEDVHAATKAENARLQVP